MVWGEQRLSRCLDNLPVAGKLETAAPQAGQGQGVQEEGLAEAKRTGAVITSTESEKPWGWPVETDGWV